MARPHHADPPLMIHAQGQPFPSSETPPRQPDPRADPPAQPVEGFRTARSAPLCEVGFQHVLQIRISLRRQPAPVISGKEIQPNHAQAVVLKGPLCMARAATHPAVPRNAVGGHRSVEQGKISSAASPLAVEDSASIRFRRFLVFMGRGRAILVLTDAPGSLKPFYALRLAARGCLLLPAPVAVLAPAAGRHPLRGIDPAVPHDLLTGVTIHTEHPSFGMHILGELMISRLGRIHRQRVAKAMRPVYPAQVPLKKPLEIRPCMIPSMTAEAPLVWDRALEDVSGRISCTAPVQDRVIPFVPSRGIMRDMARGAARSAVQTVARRPLCADMTAEAAPAQKIIYQSGRIASGVPALLRLGDRPESPSHAVNRRFGGTLRAPEKAGLVDDPCKGPVQRSPQPCDLLPVAAPAGSIGMRRVGRIADHSLVRSKPERRTLLRMQMADPALEVVALVEPFDPGMAFQAAAKTVRRLPSPVARSRNAEKHRHSQPQNQSYPHAPPPGAPPLHGSPSSRPKRSFDCLKSP